MHIDKRDSLCHIFAAPPLAPSIRIFFNFSISNIYIYKELRETLESLARQVQKLELKRSV